MSISTGEAERLLRSRRDALARRASSVAAQAAASTEILEIEAALGRIADGSYGTCERCGGAIGRDRLRSLPEVRRCEACSG